MRVIFSSLDEHREGGPMVKTIWGHEISLEAAHAEIERLETRIDAYDRELNKQHDNGQRRRLRKKLEQHEAEHDVLWRALHPVSGEGETTGIVNCRSRDCSHQLVQRLVFSTGGYCPPCFRLATKTSTEKGHLS